MFNIDIKDLIPNFIKNVFDRKINSKTYDIYSYKVWVDKINEVLRNNNYLDERHINYICDAPALNRLFYNIFHFFKPVSISDIAINIAFELLHRHIWIKPTYIIQLSKAIREKIIDEILNNKNIRDTLEKNGVTKFTEYINEKVDEQKLIQILQDKLRLRTEYFISYSSNNVNDELLKVYLPNAHEYIDWSSGPYVEVYINSYKKIELGFFRIGYDYRLMNTNEHLRFATLSTDKKYEVAEFSITRIGEITEDKIWAL